MPTKEGKANPWNHPFWSVTQSAWIETKDLKEGEILSLGDGSEISIESINHYETEETMVYNFEVEGNHTYYVSEAGVLVHNQGSEYNGVVTDPMQILYSMFAPVKKEQVSAALKKVDEPKSAMESAACNGPTGAVCTGMKVTGHLLDGEYSEAGDILVDRAGENILGFAVGYGIGGLFGIGKSFTAAPLKKDAYEGVKKASKYLKEQGVVRKHRKQVLESFEIETISVERAGDATYGLRFYGGNADVKGRYLFPTFTNYTNRSGLALPPKFNQMTGIKQFQISPGTDYIYGRTGSQGGVYSGGSFQMYIIDMNKLGR